MTSPADHELLEYLLTDAFSALLQVQTTIRAELPDLVFTPRLKTLDTIVDKLRREPSMALSKMRDIAGIRIVEEMNRAEQDALARRLRDALGGCKVVDRRSRPSFGYRALHLEVGVDGMHVEIQVRTGIQDQWAQIVERLGDSWGREVRYGGQPPDPTREIAPEFSRADLWQLVMDLSEQIDEVESDEAGGSLAEPGDRDMAATNRRQLADLLQRMYQLVGSDWV